MIDSLDTPNLTLCLLDDAGTPLTAEDALDRTAALRHALRESGLVLSVAPTARPARLAAGARPLPDPAAGPAPDASSPDPAAPHGHLGAVALAVLPPMLSALLDMLRNWLQRNPGVQMALQVAGDDRTTAHDVNALDAADEAALVAALQQHLDDCWGEVASPAA